MNLSQIYIIFYTSLHRLIGSLCSYVRVNSFRPLKEASLLEAVWVTCVNKNRVEISLGLRGTVKSVKNTFTSFNPVRFKI